jgi:Zn-dependent protease
MPFTNFDFFNFLTKLIIYGVPVVLAITLHEAAHGYAALMRGDSTALRAGRLSLNPLRHVDLFGTFLLPAILVFSHAPFVFGYAKPVPVNFSALRNPKKDMVFVAAVGPLMNILLAIASALLFHTLQLMPAPLSNLLAQTLGFSITINVTLAIFNMIPLPPLDGGRVAVGLLPEFLARPLANFEKWGFVVLVGAFIILPVLFQQLGSSFSLFDLLLKGPIVWTINIIATLTGITGI